MSKMGAPSKLIGVNLNMVKELYKYGKTDKEVAEILEVTEQTINNWKKANVDFFESLKAGKELSDDRVKKSLYDRANGWKDSEGKEYPPDTTAGIFWLKNRLPKEFRDKQEVEHSGEISIADQIKGEFKQ